MHAHVPGHLAASFVSRSGNQLYADGKPFYHLGFNAYWMPATVAYGPDFVGRVDQVLDGAQVGSTLRFVCHMRAACCSTWGLASRCSSTYGCWPAWGWPAGTFSSVIADASVHSPVTRSVQLE